MRNIFDRIDFESVFITVMIVITFITIMLVVTFGLGSGSPCRGVGVDPANQACIDERFDQCMATERYTREECIQLVRSK